MVGDILSVGILSFTKLSGSDFSFRGAVGGELYSSLQPSALHLIPGSTWTMRRGKIGLTDSIRKVQRNPCPLFTSS